MLLRLNGFIFHYLKQIELIGVLMRISSFTIVSWMGDASPFLWVWIINIADAIILSWCSILKKDRAYSILNCFWILVSIIGILRML